MALRAAAGLAVATIVSCSVITGGSLGAGLGEACETDDDCHASTCLEGACTLECEVAEDCPEGTQCTANGTCSSATLVIGDVCAEASECISGTCDDGICTQSCNTDSECPDPSICAGNECHLPMHATFLHVGVTDDQGWSFIHHQSAENVVERLPWLSFDYEVNLYTDDLVRGAAETAIEEGTDVVIHTAQGSTSVMTDLAEQYPDVKFLQLFDTVVTPPNLGAYWLRIHQGWYVAGAVAARKSQTDRIAFIGGYVSPQGVIRANGYIRGAKSVNPNIKVEVRWLGFWFDANPDHTGDEKLEVVLANQAIDSGCDVIIANLDNELSYEAIERAKVEDDKEVWSIATNNVASCAKYPETCLGVVGLNWTSIYEQQLDAMHRGTWEPEYIHVNMELDQDESPVSFVPNNDNLTVDQSLAASNLIGQLAADEHFALRGPYDVNGGQRDGGDVGEDEIIEDDELLHMCWLAEGAVERSDPEDPLSNDIPAIVPDGTITLLTGDQPDCRQNQNQ